MKYEDLEKTYKTVRSIIQANSYAPRNSVEGQAAEIIAAGEITAAIISNNIEIEAE